MTNPGDVVAIDADDGEGSVVDSGVDNMQEAESFEIPRWKSS